VVSGSYLFNIGIKSLHTQMPDILGYATDIHVEKLLAATNAKRQASGLTPLALDGQLSAAAARKAADMLGNNYWSHTSPKGATPWQFITESGYTYTVAGENLAKNFSDSQGVVEAWMASATHRDNILKSSYRDVGFAVVNGILNGEETTLVVQMFGSRTKPVSLAPQLPPVVTQVSAQTEARPAAVASAYSGVTIRPKVDITKLNHTVVTTFVGFLLAVLALDAWLIYRRRIVRASGHSIAHIAFFIAVLVIIGTVQRGSLL
ncbi:MAG: hypothetical protein UY16_C0032G0013, partial [Candidatus Gottesmanbacteria bacterium GW2011_GWA2_47_9]